MLPDPQFFAPVFFFDCFINLSTFLELSRIIQTPNVTKKATRRSSTQHEMALTTISRKEGEGESVEEKRAGRKKGILLETKGRKQIVVRKKVK